jgi:hypothetical protein
MERKNIFYFAYLEQMKMQMWKVHPIYAENIKRGGVCRRYAAFSFSSLPLVTFSIRSTRRNGGEAGLVEELF